MTCVNRNALRENAHNKIESRVTRFSIEGGFADLYPEGPCFEIEYAIYDSAIEGFGFCAGVFGLGFACAFERARGDGKGGGAPADGDGFEGQVGGGIFEDNSALEIDVIIVRV